MTIRQDPAGHRLYGGRPDGPLDDDEIVAFLERKVRHALNREEGELSEVREKVLTYYRGDGPPGEESGLSEFVSREVFEMVESAIPPLMAIFFSSKNALLFEPRGPEDVAQAEHETAVIDHYLFRRSSSYLQFQNLFKAALLDPVAYMKVHCRHIEKTIHHAYAELTERQLVELMGPGRKWNEENLEVEPFEEPGLDESLYRFEGDEITMDPEYLVEAVPPEQVLVDQSAVDLDLDDVWENYGFIAHRYDETYTELVKRFGDEVIPILEEVGGPATEVRFNDERTNRQHREDERPNQSTVADFSTREYTVYECYVKMDCDGTGIAQSWKIIYVGNKIIYRKKTSYQPFVAMSAIPQPFKHSGMSPGEALLDMQDLKTKLIRMALNDQYRNEERRLIVDRNAMTPRTKDQMMDPVSAYVEVKGPPSAAVMAEPRFSILEQTLGMIQYADDSVKRRNGMAPDVSLNPDVLRDSTAHGMLASLDRSSSRLMHYARTFAETGLRKVGVKLHALLRMYQDKQTQIQIRGEWVPLNPADWHERTDMKVAVGLGFNSKEQNLQALMQVLMLQKEALGQGLARPEHIAHTLEQMIESADLGFYGQFFVDPKREPVQPPPPPPDPKMEEVKAEIEAAKLRAQVEQARIAAEREAAQAKNDVERLKVETDRQRIAADAMLKRAQAKMESILVVEKRQAEVEKLIEERDNLVKMRQKMDAEIVKIMADANEAAVEASLAKREGGSDDGGESTDADE